MKARLSVLLCTLALTGLGVVASEPTATIRLWPGTAPGEVGGLGPEQDTTKPDGGLVAGRRLIRLGNVADPTIAVYPAPADKNTGAAVLVCPGGGYHILAMDLEGTEVCEWLNSIGVTGIVLKYRVPRRADREMYDAPLQDAQRAMGILRQRAGEFGINPKRIGVLGFSAGGHLSAMLSNHWRERTYPVVDAADAQSCRPDFSVLIYPAYLTENNDGKVIAANLPLSADTPPAFLVMAADDPVKAENALHYALALEQLKVPVELHLYPSGGHGYGLRRTDNPVTWWPERATEWLRHQGWLKRD
ncbi:MAG: alpha/beta hydrolase [Verrucomicrobiales bacterium]|nr:alpha/beta hydrolase [Verrucomicrobiales bacterium]